MLLNLVGPTAFEAVRTDDDELLDLPAHAQHAELGEHGQRLAQPHLHEEGEAAPAVGAGDSLQLDRGEGGPCRASVSCSSMRWVTRSCVVSISAQRIRGSSSRGCESSHWAMRS